VLVEERRGGFFSSRGDSMRLRINPSTEKQKKGKKARGNSAQAFYTEGKRRGGPRKGNSRADFPRCIAAEKDALFRQWRRKRRKKDRSNGKVGGPFYLPTQINREKRRPARRAREKGGEGSKEWSCFDC